MRSSPVSTCTAMRGHQLSVRLYMDALRIEGESYFLDFMPEELRRTMMLEEWYTGVVPDNVHYYPAPIPAGISFTGNDPKRELMERVVEEISPRKGHRLRSELPGRGKPLSGNARGIWHNGGLSGRLYCRFGARSIVFSVTWTTITPMWLGCG